MPTSSCLRVTLCCVALVVPDRAVAETDSQGLLMLETRAFIDDDATVTEDQGVALSGRLEVEHETEHAREHLRVYGRVDAFDEQRSSLVIEEAWVQGESGPLRLRMGVDLVNWSATEAFHPADVINSRNLDSDLENLEKLGEPMVMASLRLGDGSVSLYYLPVHMRPIFPSPRSRLSFSPGSELARRWVLTRDGELTDKDSHHQAALRLAQQVGSADIALQAVHHVDRTQPVFVFDPARGRVHPVYSTVTHFGLTYAHAIDALVIKLEAAYRYFWRPAGGQTPYGVIPELTHQEVAVGLEYNLPHESGWESTLILEGQSFFGLTDELRAAIAPFQRDALAGYRLALNDESSSELLATLIVDVESFEQALASVTYRQRLGEVWGLSIAARAFVAPRPSPTEPPEGIAALRKADHVRVALTRYF